MQNLSKVIATLIHLQIENNAMLHVVLGSIAKDAQDKERLLAEVEKQKEVIKQYINFPADAHQE